MLGQLHHLVDEVRALNSKLILLISQPGRGKTALIADKQAQAGTPVPALCREHGMNSATFYKWRAK